MILYIEEKLLSFDHFTVWDEHERVIFTGDREFFNFGKKVVLCDSSGAETAAVQHIPFSIPPAFSLTLPGRELTLQRHFALFSRSYELEELGWEIRGDFMGLDYEITCAGRTVARLGKAWPAFRDCYQLEVADPADALPALCTVIAIDCCDEQNR